jgi:protein-L-isoaspartate O-methyltransferase
MTFTPEFLLQIVVAVGAGFGSYAAIRADLARLHEIASTARENATTAHRRIDHLLEHKS